MILTDGIAPAVPARTSGLAMPGSWGYQAPKRHGTSLEVVLPAVEVLTDGGQNRPSLDVLRKLLVPTANQGRCRRRQRQVRAPPDPGDPLARTISSERVATAGYMPKPGPGYDRAVQDGKTCPVVLEPLPAGGSPDRLELVVWRQGWPARREEPAESDTPAACAGFFKQEERRDRLPLLRSAVRCIENVAEEEVASAARFVQFVTGCAVVAVVREQASLQVQSIRPVWLVAGGVEDHEVDFAPAR